MKKVVSTEMVAHLWANQSQAEAYNSTRNFKFKGRKLYCHDALIAVLVESADGETVVLQKEGTNRSYGWAPNYGRVLSCASSQFALFVVADVGNRWRGADHAKNLATYMEAGLSEAQTLSRSWTSGRSLEQRIAQLPRLFQGARRYAEMFELTFVAPNYADFEANIRASFARWNDPKKVARRAQIEKRKEHAEKTKYEAFEAWAAGRGPRPEAALYHHWSPERRMILSDQNVERDKDFIDKWITGEMKGGYYFDAGFPLLRLKPADSTVVQTSLGAEVPLSHAIKAFEFVSKCRKEGTDWSSAEKDKTLRVGLFTITRVYSTGNFQAGCHRFQWSEVERFAKSIGIIKGDPT